MNAVQNKTLSSALGRDTSLSDKYFGGDESDFGINTTSSTSSSDGSTFGINASEYVGDTTSSSTFLDTAFDSKNIGSTLGGIGSAIKGVASIYDSYNNKEYKDKIYKLEEDRVNRQVTKEAKAQAALEAAWS